MKKLNLKVSELMNPEVLTREQLKNVMGGSGVVTTTASPKTVACIGLKQCDGCSYSYNGSTEYGRCISLYGQPLHCSNASGCTN